MNAKNNKDVYKAIITFSTYLFFTIALTVISFSLFAKTSSVEVKRIVEDTGSYDQIQMKQIHLTERVDSIYFYSTMLNSEDPFINHGALYNAISSRRFLLSSELENLDNENYILYKRLSTQIGGFIQLKDSIRMVNSDLETIRNDYLRCMNRNKEMSRRIFSKRAY